MAKGDEAKIHEIMDRKKWAAVLAQRPLESGYFLDEQASHCSGVPARSLRILQTEGAIKAHQAIRPSGGFLRMWFVSSVALAAIANDLKFATGLDYRVVGKIVRGALPFLGPVVKAYLVQAQFDLSLEYVFQGSLEMDVYFGVLDNQFVYSFLSEEFSGGTHPLSPHGTQIIAWIDLKDRNTFPLLPEALQPKGLDKKIRKTIKQRRKEGEQILIHYTIKQEINVSRCLRKCILKVQQIE